MNGLAIPGQAPITYVHHRGPKYATLLTTQVPLQGEVQIHTAGGFSRMETLAMEIAKAAAQGACSAAEDVKPEELGRWAAQVAASILDECEKLSEAGAASG